MNTSLYKKIQNKNKTVLSEKEILKVREILIENNNLSKDKIDDEMIYFFTKLVFPNYYFRVNSLNDVAKIIETISAYKILGGDIVIEEKTDTGFVYIVPAEDKEILSVERKIDYIVTKSFSDSDWIEIDMHRTKGKLLNNYLNVYIVEKCSKSAERKIKNISAAVKKFIAEKYSEKYSDIDLYEFLKTKSERFAVKSEPDRISRYFVEFEKIKNDFLPEVSLSVTSDKSEYRFMISFDEFYYKKSFSALSSIFIKFGVPVTRSYLSMSKSKERNLITASYYIPAKVKRNVVDKILKKLEEALVLPDTKINKSLINKGFSLDALFFLNSFSEFAHQFLRTKDSVVEVIKDLIKNNEELKYSFTEFQMKVEHEMFAMRTIQEIIVNYAQYSELLYDFFNEKFNPQKNNRKITSVKRKLENFLKTERNEIVVNIFNTGIMFVENIVKTNFYKEKKSAIGYKLNPKFLDKSGIEELPYSIYFFYGMDFKGYHVRFQDIARGGVRIVKSRTKEEYLKNSDYNFLEVYNLAFTQEKKNKDIPEGGSKGIILPYYKNKNYEIIFYSYVDAMLDLMLKDKNIITDYDKEEDLIFLGPDEGSADFMDWAALYAKKRGYKYWRSFTTGKSDKIGGISHIEYGMTTTGVHEYVLQLLKRLNIKENLITKVQTGGPDGDLGSNEILISKDKTIAVIDGSGVAYDPQGLNRQELKRLAKKHIPIVNFNKKFLSNNGFVVSVNENNLKLNGFPGIHSGLELRNNFHFLVSADLLLPAGGRPRTIDVGNWKNIFTDSGKLRYKYIVEGANLFITQPARIKLEKSGVVLFKDSSANKGGVTSSSLEVLSSLVLDDDVFEKLMCRHDNSIPEFRKNYVKCIIDVIKKNARREFNVLWTENKHSGEPVSILSDKLSELIIRISNVLKQSKIIKQKNIREYFFGNFLPEILPEKKSIKTILKELPEKYINAVVSKEVASFFVYNTGIYWLDNVLHNTDSSEEKVIDAYLKAYFEIRSIEESEDIKNSEVRNLLRISIKERTLQLLNKSRGE